ncbi:MAG: DUF1566 domain-containing protein [Nanoarchaeota archaeon]|nr:DUF1566 domain-containing protein [Nanoarchaeota archaeon]
MRNEQRNMMNFKLISFIILMLICSSIAIADQKVISSKSDFTVGSFSDMQLNIEPTSTSCIYRYTSAGYGYYTSGQHGCDTGAECDGSGLCFAEWISGSCSGIEVYYQDVSGEKQWKTLDTACDTPQCGQDGAQDGDNLVTSNSVNFKEFTPYATYPARNACKDLDGHLPTKTELQCIYSNQASYGDNFVATYYWPSTEYDIDDAWAVHFHNGATDTNRKSGDNLVRCVR